MTLVLELRGKSDDKHVLVRWCGVRSVRGIVDRRLIDVHFACFDLDLAVGFAHSSCFRAIRVFLAFQKLMFPCAHLIQ